MKCPFCGSENPIHANFCMHCGSPQDLKACEKCGTVNRKNCPRCNGCGAILHAEAGHTQPPTPVAPTTSPHSHVQEAEALAKHTAAFKQLLSELEETIAHRNSPASSGTQEIPEEKALSSNKAPSPPLEKPSKPSSENERIIVEPPAYLEQLLSERIAKKERGRRWRLAAVITLFLLICSAGYYAAMEYDISLPKHLIVPTPQAERLTKPVAHAPITSPSTPTVPLSTEPLKSEEQTKLQANKASEE